MNGHHDFVQLPIEFVEELRTAMALSHIYVRYIKLKRRWLHQEVNEPLSVEAKLKEAMKRLDEYAPPENFPTPQSPATSAGLLQR